MLIINSFIVRFTTLLPSDINNTNIYVFKVEEHLILAFVNICLSIYARRNYSIYYLIILG